VHRRCRDDKAAVRKGALQLLCAIMRMQATWQGYPRQLPSGEDMALLECAVVDPLVGFLAIHSQSCETCCRLPFAWRQRRRLHTALCIGCICNQVKGV